MLKGPIPSLTKLRKDQEPKIITIRINPACETVGFYRLTYGTGLQICQVELRFSSCVCVYSKERRALFIYINE